METKQCTSCNTVLSATTEHFSKQKLGKYGLNSKCKPCLIDKRKEYSARPGVRAKLNSHQAKYRSNNPKKARESSKRSYDKNKDKYNAYSRDKRANDHEYRDRCIAWDKKYSDDGKRLKSNKTEEQWSRTLELSRKNNSKLEYKARNSAYSAKYRLDNRDWFLSYERNRRESLTDGYLAHVISQSTKHSDSCSISFNEVTPELIIIKRKQLKLHRDVKNYKQA
tara:strand:- start:2024 stop:2692 length:669 start_codon:yes stop_codon:yes gene_type:complete